MDKQTFRIRLFMQMGLLGKTYESSFGALKKIRLRDIHLTKIIVMWFSQCFFPDSIID